MWEVIFGILILGCAPNLRQVLILNEIHPAPFSKAHECSCSLGLQPVAEVGENEAAPAEDPFNTN